MNRESVSKVKKAKNSALLPSSNILQRKAINRADFHGSTVDTGNFVEQSVDNHGLEFTKNDFNHDLSKIPVRSISSVSIQAKLKIGQPDDQYEKEADRVAEQVMRMPDPRSSSDYTVAAHALNKSVIQKQEDDSVEQDEVLGDTALSSEIPSPDFLSLRKPFLERGVFQLWDQDSALGVWNNSFNFFSLLGLNYNWAGRAANFTAPLAINNQLKADNPAWWEISDREFQTSSFVGTLPLFDFDANFANWRFFPIIQRKPLQPELSATPPKYSAPQDGLIQAQSINEAIQRQESEPEDEFNYDFSKLPVRSNASFPIQAKLKIGQPNDKYEQEADRVAEQVMRMPAPDFESAGNGIARRNPSIVSSIGTIQRTCSACANEYKTAEDENRSVQAGKLCPKCRTKESLIQTKQVPQQIQRQESELEEEEEELLQAKTNEGLTPEVTPAISSGIQSLQGGGQPLSRSERSFFEPRFGADFSIVRIHNDSRAKNLAGSVNARAFTLGNHVVFGDGEYSPNAFDGKKLLAHELTHVVQQNGGRTTFFSEGKTRNKTNLNNISTLTPIISGSSDGQEVKCKPDNKTWLAGQWKVAFDAWAKKYPTGMGSKDLATLQATIAKVEEMAYRNIWKEKWAKYKAVHNFAIPPKYMSMVNELKKPKKEKPKSEGTSRNSSGGGICTDETYACDLETSGVPQDAWAHLNLPGVSINGPISQKKVTQKRFLYMSELRIALNYRLRDWIIKNYDPTQPAQDWVLAREIKMDALRSEWNKAAIEVTNPAGYYDMERWERRLRKLYNITIPKELARKERIDKQKRAAPPTFKVKDGNGKNQNIPWEQWVMIRNSAINAFRHKWGKWLVEVENGLNIAQGQGKVGVDRAIDSTIGDAIRNAGGVNRSTLKSNIAANVQKVNRLIDNAGNASNFYGLETDLNAAGTVVNNIFHMLSRYHSQEDVGGSHVVRRIYFAQSVATSLVSGGIGAPLTKRVMSTIVGNVAREVTSAFIKD